MVDRNSNQREVKRVKEQKTYDLILMNISSLKMEQENSNKTTYYILEMSALWLPGG